MAFGVTIIEEVVVVVVLYPLHSEQSREKSLVVNSCYVPYRGDHRPYSGVRMGSLK